jgi:3-phosphoglycerate kinase
MKKKAEEEALALAKKKAEEEKGQQMSEEERLEMQRIKEEEERKKREAEYFDYRTIHKYKEMLGRYGEIYVNDAPLATLTGSNSISEIKCSRKVLGVKVTEELRKICHFFLKRHPKDISDLWYCKPNKKPYHEKEFASIVAGSVKSVQDILDRILVINSLMDTCKEIYLGGQFALAALNSLGVKVGQIEN